MKITIQGHPTRGKEVIQILESLGGKNNALLEGVEDFWYFINSDGYIRKDYKSILQYKGFKTYTLEEFEKEFPFKIGDRVISVTTNSIGTITKLKENGWYHVGYDNGNLVCVCRRRLKLYKEMKRNITLTLDKAKEWYKKGGELKEVALQAYSKEELIESKLPKTWEEFCKNYPMKNGECYINSCCDISMTSECIEGRDIEMDKNVCPSKQSAEAHLAMIQLEQLRNCWWNGWEPIWDVSHKWCIHVWGNELNIGITTNISRFLTFPTKEMAREFLKCFRDLIETAKYLI